MRNVIAFNFLSLFLSLILTVRLEADWKADWEKVVEGAKKEGRLNLYVGRYGQAPLLEEFKKEYPQINVVTVNGTGDQLATRIVAEVRAGKTIADIYSGGPNSNFNFLYRGKVLDSIKAAFMLPELLDESKWYGGRHMFTDREAQFIFVYVAIPGTRGLSFNANLVNPKEFKSHWDLTNPKWKGKIVSQRPTDTGLSAHLQFYYYSPDLGPEYLRRLFGAWTSASATGEPLRIGWRWENSPFASAAATLRRPRSKVWPSTISLRGNGKKDNHSAPEAAQ